mgnify:CR=1 FL=1
MKALISTIEPRQFKNSNDQTISGYRVAQIESDETIFAVAEGLFWTDCANDVVADQFLYEPDSKQIIKIEQIKLPPRQ